MPRLFFVFISVFLLSTCQVNLPQENSHSGSWHIYIPEGKLSAALSPGSPLLPLVSAHRGGRFLPGLPENSLAAFEHTLSVGPAILEMDISLTQDSVLVLLHDASLDRTTNGTGKIQDKTWAELKALRLKDDFGQLTAYPIPTLEEVLEWGKGKAILSLDIKRGVPFERVIEKVRSTGTQDYVFLITYNPADAKKVHALDPDLMISATLRNAEEIARMEETGVPFSRLLAFTGTTLSAKNHYKALSDRGISSIQGTMGNLDKMAEARGPVIYQQMTDIGIGILATDRPEEALQAIRPELQEMTTPHFSLKQQKN